MTGKYDDAEDWKYKPILNGAFSTRTNYDGSGIEMEHIEEFEEIQRDESDECDG